MEYEQINGGVTAAKGFSASGLHCGIRKNPKPDLALIFSQTPCSAAAVYTTNLVKGAPIAITQRNLVDGTAQAIVCNSGNANTCNADGEEKALMMCRLTGEALGIPPEQVIVASTGVIGQALPIEPIGRELPRLAASLSADGSDMAAQAIMTTDTVPKDAAASFMAGGHRVTVGGIAKGSGMIHPNMATMLCFLTTDAAISPKALDEALRLAVEDSFNMISVDGDTSTNDMAAIMANGLAGNPEIEPGSPEFYSFSQALRQVCVELARKMAADGEGATKLLVCSVTGAIDKPSARAIAKSVIGSSLVKSATFGSDANWGRVLCAIGYAGVPVNVGGIGVSFSSSKGELEVCRDGAGVEFDEAFAKELLSQSEIGVNVTLRDGNASACAYGCDLTYDYVKINGDYRT